MCCSPSGMVGIWYISQKVGPLRGPSSVMLGDANLELPALAGIENAVQKDARAGLSQLGNHWDSVASLYGLSTPCWTPDSFSSRYMLADANLKCPLFTASNDIVPYGRCCENVGYAIVSTIAELPEAINKKQTTWEGKEGYATAPNGVGLNTSSSVPKFQQSAGFTPFNSQIACTDSQQVATGTYLENVFGGVSNPHAPPGSLTDPLFPYRPLSEATMNAYNDPARGYTRIQSFLGQVVPKTVASHLSFSNGGPGSLYGNIWIKGAPAFFLNCAFLERTNRVRSLTPDQGWGPKAGDADSYISATLNKPNETIGAFYPGYNAMSVTDIGDGVHQYASIYPVFHNCLFDGGITFPANNSVLSGRRTFIGDRVVLCTTEYNGKSYSNMNLHVFDQERTAADEAATFKQLVPAAFWQHRFETLPRMQVLDYENRQAWQFDGTGQTGTAQAQLGTILAPITWPTRADEPPTQKYPYVCGPDNRLLRTADAEMSTFANGHPEWKGLVVNSYSGSYLSDYAATLGDQLCGWLSRIPPCYTGLGTGGLCCVTSDPCGTGTGSAGEGEGEERARRPAPAPGPAPGPAPAPLLEGLDEVADLLGL